MLYDVFVFLAGKFLTKRENKNIGVILIKLHYTFHCFIASVLWFNFHFMESMSFLFVLCSIPSV